jgi:GNAT superfamily N-acetyltransferase
MSQSMPSSVTPSAVLSRQSEPAGVTIREITSAADKLRFIKFPWEIYKGDPYWVPPFISERVDFLNPKKNPSFEHMEVALFLAERPGSSGRLQVIGTIAALINHRHNQFHGEKVGFFGLFEVINNQEVACALLETAEAWVKQHLPEATAIRGPMNFSTNDECGTLIDGFEARPVVFMTYNPPYYPKLIESAGYGTGMDLYAYAMETAKFFEPNNPFLQKLERVVKVMRQRYKLTIRPANLKNLKAEMLRLKGIYNSAWEHNWGFVPVTNAEMEHLAEGIVKFVDPRLVFFVEKDGEPVAFGLTVPDVNIPVQKANGRLFPIGWLRFLLARRKIDWVRVFAMGVKEEYRNMGVDALIYYETAKAAAALGYKYAESSWILANNTMMNNSLINIGFKVYKTYRVYEKALA